VGLPGLGDGQHIVILRLAHVGQNNGMASGVLG